MRFSTLVFPKDTSNFYFIKRDINPPMDFSSVPIYLDPPPNWHQQSNHHHHHHPQISSNNNGSPQHQHHLLSLPTQQLSSSPLSHVGGGGGVSSIRRGSMADRARMANVPLPETALKCPRCDSTNTKFCYFNNYSLSQPRHFCKSCRRYWTRGGALRNVPVGGGCRRNKKNKTRRSKSPAAAPAGNETQVMNNNSNSPTTTTIPLHSSAENIIGHLQPQHPHLSFMASLNNFSRYGTTSLGLNFNEIQAQGNDIGNGALLNHHLWRGSQNFPLSGGLETPPGLYPFQISGGDGDDNTTNSILTPNSRATHLPPVKIEETQVLNLLKSSNLGINNSENNQFWSNGNGWTDLSAISSTSSGHISCDFNH